MRQYNEWICINKTKKKKKINQITIANIKLQVKVEQVLI